MCHPEYQALLFWNSSYCVVESKGIKFIPNQFKKKKSKQGLHHIFPWFLSFLQGQLTLPGLCQIG